VLIDAERANYSISWMCLILGVARSSFYQWRQQASSVTATAARRAELAVLVTEVFNEFRPRMAAVGLRGS